MIILWTNIVQFDFQNDLFTNRGLIMDFSTQHQSSSADACADQLFRTHFLTQHLHIPYPVCQTKKLLNVILSFSQLSPMRKCVTFLICSIKKNMRSFKMN